MLALLATLSFAAVRNFTMINRKAKAYETIYYGIVMLEGPTAESNSALKEYAIGFGQFPMKYYDCMIDHNKCPQMCSASDAECIQFRQVFLTTKAIFALPFYVGLDSYIAQHIVNGILNIADTCSDDQNPPDYTCVGLTDNNGYTKHHYSYQSWGYADDATATPIYNFQAKFDKAKLKTAITKLVHTPFNEPVQSNGWSVRTWYSMKLMNEIFLGTYNNADTVYIDAEYNDVDKGFEDYVIAAFDSLATNYGKSTNDYYTARLQDNIRAGYIKSSDVRTALIVFGVFFAIVTVIAIALGVCLCVTRRKLKRDDSSIDNSKA